MINKTIHYCWFGGASKSALIEMCIGTWRKVMPDYEIREWNEETFNLKSAPAFVQEALAARKWAFVADYVRLWAMYTYGGVYMDTDVKVMKRFDNFLDYGFFTCQEIHPDILPEGSILEDGSRNPAFAQVKGVGLCSAVMGAEKGCPFLKSCLDYYQNLHFSPEVMNDVVIVNLLALVLEKYGYKYLTDKAQLLDLGNGTNTCIMEPWVFAGRLTLNDRSYALHLYNGSWVEGNDTLMHRIRNRFPKIYGALQEVKYRVMRGER